MSKLSKIDFEFEKSKVDKAGEGVYGHSMPCWKWKAILGTVPNSKADDQIVSHVAKHLEPVHDQNNVMLRVADAKVIFDAADAGKFEDEKKVETPA